MDVAKQAAALLDRNGLDGRDLDRTGLRLRRSKLSKTPSGALRMAVFALLLPVFLTSLGLQVALGRLLGDSTDEGLDARTSYQFLAAFFGSLLIWPFVAALWAGGLWWQQELVGDALGLAPDWIANIGGTVSAGLLLIYLACFPLFWASGKAFAGAWDAWVDVRKAWARNRMSSEDKARLSEWLAELSTLEGGLQTG